jgi:hypothetical protein
MRFESCFRSYGRRGPSYVTNHQRDRQEQTEAYDRLGYKVDSFEFSFAKGAETPARPDTPLVPNDLLTAIAAKCRPKEHWEFSRDGQSLDYSPICDQG